MSVVRNLLNKIGAFAFERASRNPWTNVYGLGRTLLALGTAGTLAFSPVEAIFTVAVGVPVAPVCVGITQISLFCLFPNLLEITKWIAVILLSLVASGWRPRITGIFHWWVSFSLIASGVVIDGGDHITAVLTLILIPVTLTDSRRWHWQTMDQDFVPSRLWEISGRLLALSALLVARIQVAGIYFHSGISKLFEEEWADGTALFYWFTDTTFGAPAWLAPLIWPIVSNPVTVTLLTWHVIALEITLAVGLVLDKKWRRPLLILGLTLHAGIAIVHGLISFAIAMTGALVLFLRPIEQEYQIPSIMQRFSIASKKLAYHQLVSTNA